jgi:hypothetical protein
MYPSHIKTMDDERNSLETLFTARFNAYLVSAGLFSVASTSPTLSPSAQTLFWLVGAIVSSAMFLTLLRTYELVGRALDYICKEPNHPFVIILRMGPVFPKWRANSIMMVVPGIITVVFFFQFVISVETLVEADLSGALAKGGLENVTRLYWHDGSPRSNAGSGRWAGP